MRWEEEAEAVFHSTLDKTETESLPTVPMAKMKESNFYRVWPVSPPPLPPVLENSLRHLRS